jgi:hypothetical protein
LQAGYLEQRACGAPLIQVKGMRASLVGFDAVQNRTPLIKLIRGCAMSASGHFQTSVRLRLMSALPLKADMRQASHDVGFVQIGTITSPIR